MTIVIIVDVAIVAVLLAADLISKYFAAAYLPKHGGSYEVIKDVLTFRYSENSGAAFGIFENSRVFLSVFVGVVLLAILGFMVYHVYKGKYKEKGGIFLHVTLSMILAGGIGNLVDRIAFGYVRDFIEYTVVYTLFKRDFAICNLADVYLTVGVVMVVIYLIYTMVTDVKKEKAKKAALLADEKSDGEDKNE
ncbi:MAG TPA: signal peptidase II [Clostridiales bacterium]|nr:signal peptidase II [Clostridiales bacterium]